MIIRPSTLFKFHDLLKKRKYRLLYSSGRKGKPGPKGPSPELIQAIVELKRRNPRFGCLRIAQQINKAFGVDIDKDLVRRVLAKHYHPTVCAARDTRLFAAVPLQNENHSTLNGGLGQPLLPMERCPLKRNQMTLGRKTSMEGVAEETGIAPA